MSISSVFATITSFFGLGSNNKNSIKEKPEIAYYAKYGGLKKVSRKN
ncbi:MAG: hypothetical protein WBP64_07625 [Nitrososphaeraceae archaeon]